MWRKLILHAAILLSVCLMNGRLFAQLPGPPDCSSGTGSTVRTFRNGFVLRIEKAAASDDMKDADGKIWGCVVTVNNPAAKVVFRQKAHSIALLQVGNLGGGESDISLLLEGFSGGAHCCWRYWFVGTDKNLGEFAGLENQLAIAATLTSAGLNLDTNDGGFDYFDGLCHACSPRVPVYMVLRGTRLINVSEQSVPQYDKLIAESRKLLDSAKVASFRRVAKYDDAASSDFGDIIPPILNITLAYLYSGREAEARKTLDQMWPPSDVDRIKKRIAETKANGITSTLHDPKKMH